MKKNRIINTIAAFALGALITFGSTSCTENVMAKSWGGTATVDLPKGTKLVGATWKDAELWYLYREMREGESPETHTLKEQSNYGVLEGQVIFKESK